MRFLSTLHLVGALLAADTFTSAPPTSVTSRSLVLLEEDVVIPRCGSPGLTGLAPRQPGGLHPIEVLEVAGTVPLTPGARCDRRLRREQAGMMEVPAEEVVPNRALNEPWPLPPSESVPSSHYHVPRSSARGRLGERRLGLLA